MQLRSAQLLAGFILASLTIVPAVAQDRTGLRIEYSGAPQLAVIEYDVETGAAKVDDIPLLRVYGDGRVRVHEQPFRPNAGDYEMRLTEEEIADVLKSLHEDGVMTYDERSVEQEVRDEKTARAAGTVLDNVRSDVDLTVIRVHLSEYRASVNAPLVSDLRKEIRCADVQHRAMEHPGVPALRGIADAELILKAMTTDPRLRKTTEPR